MKKLVMLMLVQLLLTSSAFAISYTFSDKDYLSGASWGTMDITSHTANALKIQYTASPFSLLGPVSEGPNDPPLVTGFGFSFDTGTFNAVTNPGNADFSGDRDDLNWILYAGDIGTLPGVANGDEFTPEVTQADYVFAITEGNSNNFNPPGIGPGETDIFYLAFAGLGGLDLTGLTEPQLIDFIDLTGIRLQSLDNAVNTGSLFLAGRIPGGGGGGGDPIPEPSTFILLGAGLAGLAFYRRKKN